MKVEIRLLTPEDYTNIMMLWNSSGLTSLRPNGRDSLDEVSKQMKRDPDLFIGAFEHGKLIAVSVGSDDGRKGWINRLTVSPDYRRKGIAKMLISQTEIALKKRGRKITCVLIEDWNINSLSLFQKEGYIFHKDILYLSKRDSEDV